MTPSRQRLTSRMTGFTAISRHHMQCAVCPICPARFAENSGCSPSCQPLTLLLLTDHSLKYGVTPTLFSRISCPTGAPGAESS
ncbi:MAG: hypothetical protein IJH79_19115, partial [Lentisphaeria bacterium]|nr:hypothetical protein [Lentisphaeria bacterium]